MVVGLTGLIINICRQNLKGPIISITLADFLINSFVPAPYCPYFTDVRY